MRLVMLVTMIVMAGRMLQLMVRRVMVMVMRRWLRRRGFAHPPIVCGPHGPCIVRLRLPVLPHCRPSAV